MNRNKDKFKHLIGLTRMDIVQEMGLCFNDINSNVWRYTISTNFIYGNKYLHLHFKDNIVINICVNRKRMINFV